MQAPPSMATVFFFAADDGASGREVWMSDGTSDGTSLAVDIARGEASSYAANFVVLGDMLLFSANDQAAGGELWKIDYSPDKPVDSSAPSLLLF